MFCGYDFQFYFKLHTAKRLIHIHHPTKRNGENSMTKPIILLVEDLDDNATLVRKVLTARGYEVLWANTGQRGLDMASEHPPGLSYFRNMPELDDVPIIVVTAWPEETAKKMVTAYGCNGYIGKPVDIHLLSDTVNDYFKTA